MRRLLREVILWVVYVLVLPIGLPTRLLHRLFGSVFLYDIFAQSFSLGAGLPGRVARACFYQQTLRRAHLDLDIGFGSSVSKIGTTIGRRVLVSGRTTIGMAEIGDGAVISSYVSILSGRYQHNFTDPTRKILSGSDRFSPVRIGAESFIGEKAVIMADVGDHAIVGAGSVVIHAVPPYVVAVGNPARVVKERRAQLGVAHGEGSAS